MTAIQHPATSRAERVRAAIEPHWRGLLPGLAVVAVMVLWAVHNGGYDADTWYWGALLALGAVAATLIAGGWRRIAGSRTALLAMAAFAAYVAWSYLSIAWAQSPGDALQGSNRALLYMLVFTLMLALPWTAEGALAALVVFAVAIGVIALVILLRLASANDVSSLLQDGRLAAPTGYFNSTVALFSTLAVLGIVLSAQRRLPGLLRGFLMAIATAGLQLAVVGQSRGWLFTLPIVVIVTIVVVRDRLRVVAYAVLPVAATVLPVHRLLAVYNDYQHLDRAARQSGRPALLLCAAVFVIGTLFAWAEMLIRPPALSPRTKRIVGGALAAAVIVLGGAGSVVATHGDPFGFVSRQWRGFSHPPTSSPTGSHFATVGSGRYDIWRVSLDALRAHPIGGLGQDNFADYYIVHRKTNEEVSWTHSFEMRLLAHTGLVGFALFATFLVAALVAVARVRLRGGPPASTVAAIAVLPLVVWLVHGSVDWFWEMPALSGPALGFLGMAIALRDRDQEVAVVPAVVRAVARIPVAVRAMIGLFVLLVLVAALGFPYLSVRKVSAANDVRARNPGAALSDLSEAAKLNPLSAEPSRVAGTIALQTGQFNEAERRFRQSIDREPGGWFAWFGAGLAASALGNANQARHDFTVAASINSQQPVVKQALARADSLHPLTPKEALDMLTLVH